MLVLLALGLGILGLLVIYEIVRVVLHIELAKRLGREATSFSYDSGAPERILIIGDSIGYGVGAGNPHYSLAGRLSRDFPGCALINLSENGMNLKRLRLKLEATTGVYDHVFISIGGMDVLCFTPIPRVRRDLEGVLSRARDLSRGSVYLVSVNNTGAVPAFRFPVAPLLSWRSSQVTRAARETCAAQSVVHVPLWRARQ